MDWHMTGLSISVNTKSSAVCPIALIGYASSIIPILVNFRSQRSDFFLENLSKCIVVPVAQRMSQQAANSL